MNDDELYAVFERAAVAHHAPMAGVLAVKRAVIEELAQEADEELPYDAAGWLRSHLPDSTVRAGGKIDS